ncbi:GGDEF domain-containing protein [Serratia liquefaciens]|uniref:GGDEF domain-containing protein n=1 Tax=Serratia liquefaciens TaxID=614 RepID=UPI0023620B71|nr:GGDEF domain-containing protein [Serratia liquefaciens]
MPFLKYESGIFTKNESRIILYMSMTLSVMLCISVMVFNLVGFSTKQNNGSWVQNSGWVFDGIQLLILNFILWSFNRLLLKTSLRRWINAGLVIWIVSAAFDLMDEIIRQPMWVGYYIEDISRLTGMVCISTGIYFIVRYVNDTYSDMSIASIRDELTRLPNRRYFKNALMDLDNQSVYVFLIDIDFFKSINDKYGHYIGDDVLKTFSLMLGELFKNNVIAARVGGEEFAVIIQTSVYEEARLMAEKILTRVRELVINDEIRITVSIGAGIKKEKESQESLLRRIDIALYQAKNSGRNCVKWAAE